MHLTNYYLNRDNEQWKESESKEDKQGTKRLISITLDQLHESSIKSEKKKQSFNTSKFWKDLDDIVGKSLLAYYKDLTNSYNKLFDQDKKISNQETDGKRCVPFTKCYQVLGFDLLLDDQDKLWLLEINQNPSMEVNGNVVDDYLKRSISAKTLEIIAKTNYEDEEKVENEENDLLLHLEKDKSEGEWRCISVPSVNIEYNTIYPLQQYVKFQL